MTMTTQADYNKVFERLNLADWNKEIPTVDEKKVYGPDLDVRIYSLNYIANFIKDAREKNIEIDPTTLRNWKEQKNKIKESNLPSDLSFRLSEMTDKALNTPKKGRTIQTKDGVSIDLPYNVYVTLFKYSPLFGDVKSKDPSVVLNVDENAETFKEIVYLLTGVDLGINKEHLKSNVYGLFARALDMEWAALQYGCERVIGEFIGDPAINLQTVSYEHLITAYRALRKQENSTDDSFEKRYVHEGKTTNQFFLEHFEQQLAVWLRKATSTGELNEKLEGLVQDKITLKSLDLADGRYVFDDHTVELLGQVGSKAIEVNLVACFYTADQFKVLSAHLAAVETLKLNFSLTLAQIGEIAFNHNAVFTREDIRKNTKFKTRDLCDALPNFEHLKTLVIVGKLNDAKIENQINTIKPDLNIIFVPQFINEKRLDEAREPVAIQ